MDRIASVAEDAPVLNGVRCIGEVTDFLQNRTTFYFTYIAGNGELPRLAWANRYGKTVVEIEDPTEVILKGDIDYWTKGWKIDLKP